MKNYPAKNFAALAILALGLAACSLGFIGGGGSGGGVATFATAAGHADNLDNGGGTNVVMQGTLQGTWQGSTPENSILFDNAHFRIFDDGAYGNPIDWMRDDHFCLGFTNGSYVSFYGNYPTPNNTISGMTLNFGSWQIGQGPTANDLLFTNTDNNVAVTLDADGNLTAPAFYGNGAKLTGISGGYAAITEIGGNVGIGTTSPAAKLDVAGDVHVSGTNIVNGSIQAKTYMSVGFAAPGLNGWAFRNDAGQTYLGSGMAAQKAALGLSNSGLVSGLNPGDLLMEGSLTASNAYFGGIVYATNGVALKSPDGALHYLHVDNSGNLSTSTSP